MKKIHYYGMLNTEACGRSGKIYYSNYCLFVYLFIYINYMCGRIMLHKHTGAVFQGVYHCQTKVLMLL